jgi:predicted DNA-binding transcriptional regulator AlpA
MDGLGATERLWSHKETATFLHISPSQLYALNGAGEGPPSFKVGSLRRYDPQAVRTWLRQHSASARAVTA